VHGDTNLGVLAGTSPKVRPDFPFTLSPIIMVQWKMAILLEIHPFLTSMIMELLMEEILHHLGCIKPCKKWERLHINCLAGFLKHQQEEG